MIERTVVTIALVLLLVLLGAGIALLAVNEAKLIYFPTREYAATPELYGLRGDFVEVPSSDGIRLYGWWIHGRGQTVLLYFHGNAGNISHRLDRTKLLVDSLGLDVLLVDYRGYGRSEGRPSEKGLYADGEAIYDLARGRGFPQDRIVLFGESLGSAVAIETALHRPARALILEAPFLSIPKMARAVYPFLPTFLARTRFDNESKIERIVLPKLIAAADNDGVVPFGQTRRLYELAPEPKVFFVARGASHNNIYIVGGAPYLEAWRKLLEAH